MSDWLFRLHAGVVSTEIATTGLGAGHIAASRVNVSWSSFIVNAGEMVTNSKRDASKAGQHPVSEAPAWDAPQPTGETARAYALMFQ